jgi:hypothetical protein
MESEDRELMRENMDRSKQLEYLSSVENERNRVSGQIEQLRRQIGQLTQKKVDLDKEWREGMLSVQATYCKPILAPSKGRKIDPRKKTIDTAIKGASAAKLAKIADLLQKAGIEL